MAELQYRVGDATDPDGTDPRIIVHVCNDIGAWGAGFVLALSQRWSEPEQQYRRWHQGHTDLPFELGQMQLVPVDTNLWVANVIGQRSIRRRGGLPPIRYDALRHGVQRVAHHAKRLGASVHMPRIGTGLAGGRWEDIEPIIQEELVAQDIDVIVYDLARSHPTP